LGELTGAHEKSSAVDGPLVFLRHSASFENQLLAISR
jgi:hypothetical protein